jgi:PadR family transcriptional regulator, regulatory protein PadR
MLGKLEELVLLGLMRAGTDVMASDVYEKIHDVLGSKNTSFGAVFTTLDRLVDKKFVTRKELAPSEATKGRVRRIYTISGEGRLALTASVKVTADMVIAAGLAGGVA